MTAKIRIVENMYFANVQHRLRRIQVFGLDQSFLRRNWKSQWRLGDQRSCHCINLARRLRTEEKPVAVLAACVFDYGALPSLNLIQMVHGISETRWPMV
jgi:hypothetical protein